MSDGVWWPEFKAWLLAHGIDPDDTAQVCWRPPFAGAGAGDLPQCIEVMTYRRNANGDRYLNDNGAAATETRVVPMLHLPAVEIVRYRSRQEDGR